MSEACSSGAYDDDMDLAHTSLNRDEQRSAFTPYKVKQGNKAITESFTRVRFLSKAATVLTNLQRGNVQAKTPTCIPDRSVHQLAAQGELFANILDGLTNVDVADEHGYTPLIWAASFGQLATVKLLADRGANVNFATPTRETAMHFASNSGHLHVIKELINRGGEVNAVDEVSTEKPAVAEVRCFIHCSPLLFIFRTATHR